MSLTVDRIQIELEIKSDKSRLRAKELEGTMKDLKKSLKGLKEGTEDYNRTSLALKKARLEYDKIMDKIGLAGMSMRELRNRQRELNAIIGNMSPKSKSYSKLRTELDAVNARMKVLRGNAQATGLSIGKIADGFNKYFGMIGMFVASFTGAVMGFRKLVEIANNFEERVDNLSAITGLMGDQLDWLSDKAKQTSIDTIEGNIKIKQSADAIVDAYTKVGSQRPELLKNKEALHDVTQDAIILSEAAKTKLEPAVEGLTMAMNQLNYEADESRRIINVMAAGSKEGSADIPYLTDAFEKSGTTARLMNIDIEQLTGSIEAIAPSYSEASMAGNSFDKVLLKMKANQIGYKDGQFDLIRGIEELENRYASGETAVNLFGSEHAKMGELLVLNKQHIIDYTAAVTDTNVAIEQAAKNTNNRAADLEQAKNKFQLVAIELGEKLAPALTFSTNGFSYLMKAMVAGIEVWKEHKTLITSAALGIGVYTAAVKASVVWDKAKVFWNEKIIASMGKIQKLNRTQIWGLVAAGITMAVGALIEYNSRMTVTEKIKKDFNKSVNESQGALKAEFEALKNTKEGTDERRKAIKLINEKYGDYLDNLLTEKSTLEEIETAQKAATEAMYQNMLMQNKKEAFAKVYAKYQQEQQEIIAELSKTEGEHTDELILQAQALGKLRAGSTEYYDQVMKGASATKAGRFNMEKLSASYNNMNSQLNILTSTFGKMTKEQKNSKTEIEKLDEQIASLIETQKQFEKGSAAYKTVQKAMDPLIKQRKKLSDALNDNKDDDDDTTNSAIKNAEKEAKEQRKLQKIIIDNMEESYAKRVAMENWRYEGIVASAEKEIEHEQIKNAILEQEALAHQRRLGDILASDIGDMPDDDFNNDEGIDPDEEVKLEALAAQQEDLRMQQEWELELFYQTAEGKKAILKEQLDNQEISYAEYIAKIREIDKISLDWKLTATAGTMGKMAALFHKDSVAYQILASGEALIATYLGASKDLAEGPPYIKYAMAAATIATGLANVAKINGVAFADGYYPVQTQNGMYNVAYGGSPTTQIVSSPKHFVAGEQGAAFPELIVDGPTFNHVRANFPEAIDAIMYSRNKVKGYADGYYPDSLSSGTASTNQVMDQLTQVMARVDNIFTRIDQEGVSVSYNKLDESQREIAEIEQNVTL